MMIRRLWTKFRLLTASSARRIAMYRSFGVRIGDHCRIIGRVDFGSEPYLVSLGDHVTVTNDVIFLTHDGGVGLFRKEHPGMNVYAPVKVGSRVFIGNRAILLPGVSIGDDVVIGAGSVVTKDIPAGSVVAGVPARVLRDIDSYKETCLSKADFVDSSDSGRLEQYLRDVHPEWFA